MASIINAVSSTGITQTADGSGIIKLQSAGVTTNALAWVNFNGVSGSVAIRAQYNVSSVTRNSTGNYTITFTNAQSDANYTLSGTCEGGGAATNTIIVYASGGSGTAPTLKTTTACQILGISSGAVSDFNSISVMFFGN